MFEKIAEKLLDCSIGAVSDALDIWLIKPHVVNRRLAGCNHISTAQNVVLVSELLTNFLADYAIDTADIVELLSGCFNWQDCRVDLTVRKLLPRDLKRHLPINELVVKREDSSEVEAFFIPIKSSGDDPDKSLLRKSYSISYNARTSRFFCSTHQSFDQEEVDSSIKLSTLVATKCWLVDTLLDKIKTWSIASHQSGEKLRKTQSLACVDIEKYTALYTELKKKYGAYFVEIWPESTDPLKFVYEDIAIATYLILVWEKEREELEMIEKQSFVDLGCGNGLLVHILSSEGYKGRGVDINKRKIWQLYGPETVLEEKALNPETMVVEEDWIIGNHSDELTPWIPVIASRSSYSTRYFVLPCCFFDFHKKFHHREKSSSQYSTYLKYVRLVGERSGFEVVQDTLRIPSTKRVCHLGRKRTYEARDKNLIENSIQTLIEDSKTSLEGFVPRKESSEPRNCSKTDKTLLTNIVNAVAEKLLSSSDKVCVTVVENKDRVTTTGVFWIEWNNGGRLHLNEVATMFDNDSLQQLKCQCGGLQTVLKNNRNIFKVVGGFVSFRDYRLVDDMKPSSKSSRGNDTTKIKTKLCWFFTYHPNGCVLTNEQCKFAHGDGDIINSS